MWQAFLGGAIAERNAATTAQFAATLPEDAPGVWQEFDALVLARAKTLPPTKFRLAARVVRERVHPESIEDRHRRSRQDRRTWITPELDGMATLTVFGPAAEVHAAFGRADATARHLAAQPGEDRTLAQLRTDTMLDLLADGHTDATTAAAASGRAAIAVTLPVMTLLGQSEEPATLDGYGPIDLDTAKRFAGTATSWVRILTHPITGTVLDVDRKVHQVPQDLRRWVQTMLSTCIFPGCTRSARDCDIDHRIEWQHGGPTRADNLGPQCEPHHRLKTESKWQLYRCPVTNAMWWTSPTAKRTDLGSAPF